ncbi:MAG: cupin domain-containing protein [Hyphomicrobiaceae bacterium]
MDLNADFTKRVAVHAAALEWKASPIAGVDRRMLDRIGDEVARATSIVRYAPESRFSPHVHAGGEEFLVLDGVFQDEHGDFPAGSYIRNPPQSRHTPGSKTGCTIFVKLWQFDLADRTHVRLDTNTMAMREVEGRDGVEATPLFKDVREDVRLEQWAPSAAIEFHPVGGLEVLVLAGNFSEGGESFVPQSWLRLPIGARFAARAGTEGCRLWLKEGHLRHVQSGPRTNP